MGALKNIVFDAFGTLITYNGQRINPYMRLVKTAPGAKAERMPFLTRNVGIDVFARELGLEYLLPVIERELAQELSQLRLFDDVATVLQMLRTSKSRIAVCSNLAHPYGSAVRTLLPGLDGYVFSYEVGAKKPEPAIYEAVCKMLACRPSDVLFVGDSKRADFDGPLACGMQARLLDRKAGQNLASILLA